MIIQMIYLYLNTFEPTAELIDRGIFLCDYITAQPGINLNIDCYRLKAEILYIKRRLDNTDEKKLTKLVDDNFNIALTLSEKHKTNLFKLRVLEARARLYRTKKYAQTLKQFYLAGFHP